MNLINRLQIILVTYNRAQQLQRTLSQLFADDSPVQEFHITILDNKSSDDTPCVINAFKKDHPNLSHIINKHNIGGSANIAHALEMATFDYAWIICDDDDYHWDAWPEVELAIERGYPLFCVANHIINPQYRDQAEYQLYQMTFLPSTIWSRQVLNDAAIRNAYDNVFALFPHLAPVVGYLNAHGTIHVNDKCLVTPGKDLIDTSYTRGHVQSEIFIRARTLTFTTGYANLILNLKGRNVKHFFSTMVNGDSCACQGWKRFFADAIFKLDCSECAMHFCDLLMVSPWHIRLCLHGIMLLHKMGVIRLYLFSLKHLQGTWLYWTLRRIVDKLNAMF